MHGICLSDGGNPLVNCLELGCGLRCSVKGTTLGKLYGDGGEMAEFKVLT